MKQPPDRQRVLGWILYDDSCGFCRRWIPFWKDALQRRGLSIAPLQTDWVRAKLQLSESELLYDLRLLLVDGSQIRGADVYRYAMRRIWWAWPIYLFSITPGLGNVFDWGYRTFAANRFRVSSACGLDIKN
jgi:predicted DCC family thiol-disulfide oxidoreductase YuxK